MSEKLAKGLTRRFFKDHDQSCRETLNKFGNMSVDGSTSKRAWDRHVAKINRMGFFHVVDMGTKKHPSLCVFHLLEGDYNPVRSFDEASLLLVQFVTSRRDGFDDYDKLNAIVSHHCIQRIFQRGGAISGSIDEIYDRRFVYNELRPIIFWSFIYNYFFGMCMDTNEKLFSKISVIPVLIPTTNGLLLSELIDGQVLIRTFLHEDDLNESQSEIRTSLMRLSSKHYHADLIAVFFSHLRSVSLKFPRFNYDSMLRAIALEAANNVENEVIKDIIKQCENRFFQGISSKEFLRHIDEYGYESLAKAQSRNKF